LLAAPGLCVVARWRNSLNLRTTGRGFNSRQPRFRLTALEKAMNIPQTLQPEYSHFTSVPD